MDPVISYNWRFEKVRVGTVKPPFSSACGNCREERAALKAGGGLTIDSSKGIGRKDPESATATTFPYVMGLGTDAVKLNGPIGGTGRPRFRSVKFERIDHWGRLERVQVARLFGLSPYAVNEWADG